VAQSNSSKGIAMNNNTSFFDSLDHLLLLSRAGLSLSRCVNLLANHSVGATKDLVECANAVLRGQSWQQACSDLASQDDRWRFLAKQLDQSTLRGTSVITALELLLVQCRTLEHARRRTAIRSVAVKSTLPLGLCLLPAFVLLTVVPMVVVFGMNVLH
jgi:hypothetical protein